MPTTRRSLGGSASAAALSSPRAGPSTPRKTASQPTSQSSPRVTTRSSLARSQSQTPQSNSQAHSAAHTHHLHHMSAADEQALREAEEILHHPIVISDDEDDAEVESHRDLRSRSVTVMTTPRAERRAKSAEPTKRTSTAATKGRKSAAYQLEAEDAAGEGSGGESGDEADTTADQSTRGQAVSVVIPRQSGRHDLPGETNKTGSSQAPFAAVEGNSASQQAVPVADAHEHEDEASDTDGGGAALGADEADLRVEVLEQAGTTNALMEGQGEEGLLIGEQEEESGSGSESESDGSSSSDSATDNSDTSEDEEDDDEDEQDSDEDEAMEALLAKARISAQEAEAAAAGNKQGDGNVTLFGHDEEEDMIGVGAKEDRKDAPIPDMAVPRLPKPHLTFSKDGTAQAATTVPEAGPSRPRSAVIKDGKLAKDEHGLELDDRPYERTLTKKEKAAQPRKATPSELWATIPTARSDLLPSMKRDYQALALANSLDPKRFMKGGAKTTKVPEHFAIGTLIEPPRRMQETTNVRERKYRAGEIVESLVADQTTSAYAKRKYGDLQWNRMENGRGKGWQKRSKW